MTKTTTRPQMVTTSADLDSLCDELSGEDVYGFDTEFHTERTYFPQLALIQLAWRDQVALVDPLAVDPAPLATVFAGPRHRGGPCRRTGRGRAGRGRGPVPGDPLRHPDRGRLPGHVDPVVGPAGRPCWT